MVEISKNSLYKIASMFKHFEQTLVLSCLQGHMGRAWTDEQNDPTCALIVVGDCAFFAGDYQVGAAIEMVDCLPEVHLHGFILAIPKNAGWGELIAQRHAGRYDKYERYAMAQDGFDTQKLAAFVDALPAGYEIRLFDHHLYLEAMGQEWSRDFCSQFDSADDYLARGIGFGVVRDGMLVCGASSYTVYDAGIEIQVDTVAAHQRKGLATSCASALILACLAQGKHPGWDAANEKSLRLAKKLGYRLQRAYDTYEIEIEKV